MKKTLLLVLLGLLYIQSQAQVVNDDKYAIRTFATHTLGYISEIAIDQDSAEIYFTVNQTGNGTPAPIYRYDLSADCDTLGTDWTGTNWHPFVATDIEFYKDSIYSYLPAPGQIVSFNTNTFLTSYNISLPNASETGSAIVEDTLWTCGGSSYFKIDLTKDSILGTYSLGSSGYTGLEYCAKTNKLYYMSSSSPLREVYMDGSGLGLIIGGPSGTSGNFAVDPDGAFAYVRLGNTIIQIDIQTGATTTFITGLNISINSCDLEFGPSSMVPGSYSLYIGDNNRMLEVYTTLSTDSIVNTDPCTPQSIEIPFTAGTYRTTNIFTAQLSDTLGSFANPTAIGTINAQSSDTIIATIPVVPVSNKYRIRVVSSDPITYGKDNGVDLFFGDTTMPVLAVQNHNLYLDSTGNATLFAADVITTSTDNCTVQDTTLSQTAFSCLDVNTTQNVDVSINDIYMNTTTLTSAITILDSIAPSFDIQNINVYLDSNGTVSITEADVMSNTWDNCMIADSSLSQYSFDCNDIAAPVSIDVSLSDSSSNITTHSTLITVIDTIYPQLSVQNYTLQLDSTGNAILEPAMLVVQADDNCTIIDTLLSEYNFDCSFNDSTVVIGVSITDTYGNTTTNYCAVAISNDAYPVYHHFISDTICNGETYTLGTQNLSLSGNYDESFTSQLGCDSLVSLDLYVHDVNTNVSILAFSLNADASGATYQWLDCDNAMSIISGETAQTYNPTVDGNYAVIINDGICLDTSACYTIVGIGIEENTEHSVNIYPNPTKNSFTVDCKDFTTTVYYSLYAVDGRIIAEGQTMENSFTIDLSKEEQAVYFLRLRHKNETEVYKIIKQ